MDIDFTCAYPTCRSAIEIWKRAGRRIHIRIHGSSMSPLLNTGDSVSIRLTASETLKTGDVFAFWEGENIVVHRLIKKKRSKDGLRLCQKGDNLTGWSWIHEDNVMGKVELVCGSRRRLDMTRRPLVWINPAFGFTSWILISLLEKMRLLKVCCLGNRPVSLFSPLTRWTFKAINGVTKFDGLVKR